MQKFAKFVCLLFYVLVFFACGAQLSASPEGTVNNADAPSAATQSNPMILTVDARQAARGILFSHMVIPVKAGEFTLVFPKWIPGEHSPSGPLSGMAMLSISAGASSIPWQRDLVNMYAFHFNVPQGVSMVDLDMDVLMNTDQGNMSTANLAVINWNRVLLYQAETNAAEVFVKSRVLLPSGWDFGTALPVAARNGNEVDFDTVSLSTLVDSPLDCGKFARHIPLWSSGHDAAQLDVFADKPRDLDISPELLRPYRNVVPEGLALYGARHWRSYHFLLSLSSQIRFEGIEHHESSDNRSSEDFFTQRRQLVSGGLLTHEFSHSWNGKYRRPADLTTPNFQIPQQTDLLWVYEGLNEYLGDVLAFRSGIRPRTLYPELVASMYAHMDAEPGRERDPLADTAAAAPYLFMSSGDYPTLRRRGGDFYTEGELLWLDADTIIRERSSGAKSLDDFLHLYAGAPDTGPMVKTYTRAEIEADLNRVQPYDWHSFFEQHVYQIALHPPQDEIARSGWALVFSSKPNIFDQTSGDVRHRIDLWYSVGLDLDSDGGVNDVRSGSPAWQAGFAPHMRLVAIDGVEFSREQVTYAVETAAHDRKPIAFLTKSGEWYKTLVVNYGGGLRYPHLVRLRGKPDMLSSIMSPHAH